MKNSIEIEVKLLPYCKILFDETIKINNYSLVKSHEPVPLVQYYVNKEYHEAILSFLKIASPIKEIKKFRLTTIDSKNHILSLKGSGTYLRREVEYNLSDEEADFIIKKSSFLLEKTRHGYNLGIYNYSSKEGKTFYVEIDEYKNGLQIIEIEVSTEEELKHIPDLGTDVTENDKYSNINQAIKIN